MYGPSKYVLIVLLHVETVKDFVGDHGGTCRDTESAAGADPDEFQLAGATGVVEQLHDLVQHDGHAGITHPVLQ